jgi:soluble lytic murein transglycosylase
MQITPSTGQWIAEQLNVTEFTEDALFDPELNVQFGTWYLRHLLDQFNDNVEATLIAYNAGPSNLRRWQSGDGVIFPETVAYVAKVQRAWSDYRFLYELPVLRDLLQKFPF